MRPQYHLLSSVIIGSTLYIFTLNKPLSLSAGAAGFLIDLDHLLVFWRAHPQHPFSLKDFLNGQSYIKKIKKIYLIFHSWELALALLLLGFFLNNALFLGTGLGLLAHLFLDQRGNSVYRGTYFFVWRLWKNFKTNQVLKKI